MLKSSSLCAATAAVLAFALVVLGAAPDAAAANGHARIATS